MYQTNLLLGGYDEVRSDKPGALECVLFGMVGCDVMSAIVRLRIV
jgi:hypothetical protein